MGRRGLWSPTGDALMQSAASSERTTTRWHRVALTLAVCAVGTLLGVLFAIEEARGSTALHERFVFVNGDGGKPPLEITNTDGGDPAAIEGAAPISSQPALSPDGTTIAFNAGSSGDLSITDTDSGTRRLLYGDGGGPGHYSDPAWTPDQQSIVFDSNGQGTLISGLWMIDADGSDLRYQNVRNIAQPAVSRDGRLAFAAAWTPGTTTWASPSLNEELFVETSPGTGSYAKLTSDADVIKYIDDIAFLPNGAGVVLLARTSANVKSIYTINLDGTGLTKLIDTVSGTRAISLLPDGSKIYYDYGGSGIRAIEVDGTDGYQVLAGNVRAPSFRQPSSEGYGQFLAARFRPILRFDEGEKWRPLDVPRFFAERDSVGNPLHILCTVQSCQGLEDANTLNQFPNSAWMIIGRPEGDAGRDPEANDWRSPDPACVQGGLLDCDAGEYSRIYTTTTTRSAGYEYADYWWFYRYNEFPGTGSHEGDWEGMTIAPSLTVPGTFDFVAFDQHGRQQTYLRETLTCDAGTRCGSDFAQLGGPDGTRVWAYVAGGSHATYPTACSNLCLQDGTLPLPETDHGGERPWGRNNDPGSLHPLPKAIGWGASGGNWTDWPGRWGGTGGVGGPNSPKSPGNQRRYSCPWTANSQDQTVCSAAAATSADRHAAFQRCDSWAGGDVVAALCSPARLRSAIRNRALGRTGRFRLVPPSRKVRGASAPGIAQLVGRPLRSTQSIGIRGRVPSDAILTIRFAAGHRQIGVATFKGLRGSGRIVLVRKRNGQMSPVLRTARGEIQPTRRVVRGF